MNSVWLNVNTYFPSRYYRGPNSLVWLAIVSLFMATFIKLWTPTSLNRWPEALYTLLFIYPLLKHWHWLKQQRLMQLFGVALIAPFAFYGINLGLDPEQAQRFFEYEKLPRIYLLIPIAWWLGAHPRTIALFLATALAGFLFALLQDPTLNQTLERLFAGRRVDFGILNAQHVALFFGLALVGAASYLTALPRIRPLGMKLYSAAALFAVIVVSGIGLYGTQTRAAWLALVVTGAFAAMVAGVRLLKHTPKPRLPWVAGSFVLVLTIALGGLWQLKEPVEQRLASESQTLAALIARDWDNVPYTSIGVRINTWRQAAEWIAEKPLIGHGAKVRLHIIQQSDKHPNWVKKAFGHFHNSFIELTLGFGLLGLALALYPMVLAVKLGFQQRRSAAAHFAVFGLVLFGVMNFFESYLFFWMGPYLLTLLAAPMLSHLFNQQFRFKATQ